MSPSAGSTVTDPGLTVSFAPHPTSELTKPSTGEAHGSAGVLREAALLFSSFFLFFFFGHHIRTS